MGCGDSAARPRPTSSETQPVAGTFEEAALVALGELFRIYGIEADPVPLEVTGEVDTYDGQAVWRVDGTYEAMIDGTRRAKRWRFWIGATADAPLAVVESELRS